MCRQVDQNSTIIKEVAIQLGKLNKNGLYSNFGDAKALMI